MLPSRKPTIMPSLYLPLLLKKTKQNKQTNKQRKRLTTTTKACQKNAGSKTNGSTNLSTSNRCAKDLLTKGCRLNASERLVCVLLPFNRVFSHDVTTVTMKRRPCLCPKPVLWELNSFLMQTLSFVPINLHRCWPRE